MARTKRRHSQSADKTILMYLEGLDHHQIATKRKLAPQEVKKQIDKAVLYAVETIQNPNMAKDFLDSEAIKKLRIAIKAETPEQAKNTDKHNQMNLLGK